MAIINFYKEAGETPLEAIRRFQIRDSRFLDSKITYAGRLDPLAEGVLILLTDDDVHKKDDFLKLQKEYEFEVLFRFKTDTGDILGKILESTNNELSVLDIEKTIPKILKEFLGKQTQTYPMYSSKTVAGKPLFSYARNKEQVSIPSGTIEIYSLEYLGSEKIESDILLSEITLRIGKVKGDFRQSDILNNWNDALKKAKSNFIFAKFKVNASSGTYVRVLAEQIGAKLNVLSLAYKIKRTRVGDFNQNP